MSRRRGVQFAPPVEIVEVDPEEGSNPDQKLSYGRPARAIQCGRVPEVPPAAGVAEVAMALATTGTTPQLSACRSMGTERHQINRPRGASSRKDERPEATIDYKGA